MKKKEILLIFVLAVFLTGVNLSVYEGRRSFRWAAFPLSILATVLSGVSCFETGTGLVCPTIRPTPFFYLILVIVDFLFWFLVLVVFYHVGWGIKRMMGDRRTK